jgi:D-beta-D-heptose 7-phosphate kinase/D-beta-D-heptose 1-phosphate adenosyltransferase
MRPHFTTQPLPPLSSCRILVVGDVILDRYTWGDADRISPEAPVLVLKAGEREIRPGGAASVAALARGLGATVSLAGLVGDDPEGKALAQVLREERIETRLLYTDPERPTTVKERFLGRAAGRHPHQILRVDRESTTPIDSSQAASLAAAIKEKLPQSDALLIADYAKGVCAPELIQSLIQAARTARVPVIVDPGRGLDFGRYRGARLIKPNRREAELALGTSIVTTTEARDAAARLGERADAEAVLLTMDRDGMILWQNSLGEAIPIPTTPQHVYDITGAGDMVLAALGLAMGSGWPLVEAARFANVAAGLEITQWGVSPVPLKQVLGEFSRAATPEQTVAFESRRLVTREEAVRLAQEYRARGIKIALTNGCFDLLHAGHVASLEQAAACGDVLFVATNSDRSIRQLKGPGRPVIPERQRAQMLASLRCGQGRKGPPSNGRSGRAKQNWQASREE